MGDPSNPGGVKQNRPKVIIDQCHAGKIRGLLDSRQATEATRYKVVADPEKGKTTRLTRTVAPGKAKRFVLRKQKSGTVVSVAFNGKTVQRKLRC